MVFCNCKLSYLKSRKLNQIPYPAFKLQIKRKETEQIVLSKTGGHSAIPPTHHENENTDNDNTSKGQQQKYSIGTVSKKYWGRGGEGGTGAILQQLVYFQINPIKIWQQLWAQVSKCQF